MHRQAAFLLAASVALSACGAVGPPPATYVLGMPASGPAAIESLAGRPVVEVKPVLVPDYLDVSDMLLGRSSNELVQSRTGRWGERLSVGFTRALADGLARRLPAMVVTTTAPPERGGREVLVDVDAFEPLSDGSVTLVAHWRVLDGTRQRVLTGERVRIRERVPSTGDAGVAAAMTQAIEDLAARVAQGIQHAAEPGQRRQSPPHAHTGHAQTESDSRTPSANMASTTLGCTTNTVTAGDLWPC